MSMHWKPESNAKPVVLGKSRIRRDPVPLEIKPTLHKAPRLTSEQEMLFGVAGILLLAACLVAAIVGISWATWFRDDSNAAAQSARFGQCYNAIGPNCVVDGDTIYLGGTRITIAGLEAPGIQSARCDTERDKGIDAAVQLQALLNSGSVTVSRTFRDDYGRNVSTVTVKGRDVAAKLIDAGVAREYQGTPKNWCA
jgi:endonuclease YncB( thermonuclease family)